MKKLLLVTGFSTIFGTISMATYAANYNSFVTSASLGKDINTLNKQYKLGLKKQNKNSYSNDDSEVCRLSVGTDENDRVNSIKIITSAKCQYTAKSNVNYISKSTTIKSLLSQVDIENIQFIPGCFNCSPKLKTTDNLIISRTEDNYYTEFEIQGYNKNYKDYIAKKLFGSLEDDYHSMMNMLKLRSAKEADLYDRNEFKLQAIKAYNLNNKLQSYTIALK